MLVCNGLTMKKILSIILILVSLSSLYSVDLKANIGIKSSSIESPVYGELSLTKSFDMLSFFTTYQIGYDILNDKGYNTINFGVSLSFCWGDIVLRKEYGTNVNKTELRLEF